MVEYFDLLETTQHLNHLRPHSLRTPDEACSDACDDAQTEYVVLERRH